MGLSATFSSAAVYRSFTFWNGSELLQGIMTDSRAWELVDGANSQLDNCSEEDLGGTKALGVTTRFKQCLGCWRSRVVGRKSEGGGGQGGGAGGGGRGGRVCGGGGVYGGVVEEQGGWVREVGTAGLQNGCLLPANAGGGRSGEEKQSLGAQIA